MSDCRFTAADLRRLAGDTVFKRGEAYVREGAVRLVEVTPGRIDAEVTGSETYETTLTIPASGASIPTAPVRTRTAVISANTPWRRDWRRWRRKTPAWRRR